MHSQLGGVILKLVWPGCVASDDGGEVENGQRETVTADGNT